MQILITGGKGQLGLALQGSLADHDLTIADLPEIDITDQLAFNEFVQSLAPDVIIHCAAMTNVDACARDPRMAFEINALGTRNVALAALEAGARMMHISTNEVFRGDRPDGYEEWVPHDPINPYGVSKAAAENFVADILDDYYIIRTSWIYSADGRNFIHTIRRLASEHGQLRVVTDEVATPTLASDLAGGMAALLDIKVYGNYHLVNEGYCSRFEFAEEILCLSGMSNIPITPILLSDFKRDSTPPRFAALKNVAGAALGISLRPWQEALAEFIQLHG